MKGLLKVLLPVGVAFAVVVATALGQGSSFIHGWQLDENGPAFFIMGTYAGISQGTNKVDSASGILGRYYPLIAECRGRRSASRAGGFYEF
jgi:hypothetical protein